jgi:hypothetical protein
LIAFVFCLVGIFIALCSAGFYLGASKAEAQSGSGPAVVTASSPNGPDVARLLGPVVVKTDLRDLPYIPPTPLIPEHPASPYTRAKTGSPLTGTSRFAKLQASLTAILPPIPLMPQPLLTFDGISREEGDGDPPDTNGDVGPNHYVQAVNQAFKVFDKSGNTLSGPTTFNSFFAPLGNSTLRFERT